ncbi:37452_t:CDS:2, partial [Gigaspora margarita]
MHAIEFQKHGLSHAHIIIKSDPNLIQLKDIDNIIYAKLPTNNDAKHKRLYELMLLELSAMHTKNTVINELDHVYYRCHTKNDINIVLYNAFLLLKLNCHINVEVASTSYMISYLYKYIYKEPDHASINISIEQNNEPEIIDEINNYLNKHYLFAMVNFQIQNSLTIAINNMFTNTFTRKTNFKNEQCITKAISYNCTLAQLCLLFWHLILEGIATQIVWQNYQKLLSANYINKKENIQQGKDEALMLISNFLEEHGIKLTQIGLPQPLNHLSEVMHVRNQYSNYNILIAKSEEMINQLDLEQKSIYQKIMMHVYNNIPLIIFINDCAAALNYDGGCTAHLLFHIPVEHNDNGYKRQINPNRIGDFCQVAPVILNAKRIATILESIKLSTIWNLFEIYDLQQPVQDASDSKFLKFIDDVGDGINGEDISLLLLNSTNDLNEAINFVFLINILNNPILCLQQAILSQLNKE